MKNIKIKNSKRLLLKLVIASVYAVICCVLMATNVFAADDPIAVVNNLSNFIFGLIRAVGMIILGFGGTYAFT